MTESTILDTNFEPTSERRRKLLPIWIKVCIWFYMISGGLTLVVILLSFFTDNMNFTFLGLKTNHPFSINWFLIVSLYLIKCIVAFGLWTEKDWAVNMAIVDAYISIGVCMSTMLILPMFFAEYAWDYTLRIELVAIIPYLLKMKGIHKDWQLRKAHA